MPTTEKIIYYDQSRKAIAVESSGKKGAWGCFIESYKLEGNKVLYSWYADHTCSMDCWDKPIRNDSVPDSVKAILGKPIAQLQPQFGDEFKYQPAVADSEKG